MNREPLLLTEAEAALRLQVCTRTLRKARHSGLLHYVLIGRSIRYTMADLESYIERLRQVQPNCPLKEPTRRISLPSRKGGEIVPFTERNRRR
ncbi:MULTISPECIES: helix-turn-helix domain-containing protein [unclassified Novosphingobium]|uniref:helix-turn-helix domain-containing protein n=1 Tax=unclassified Novosphingobium TaxID=2644732 RepID=UPI001359B91D